MCAGHGTNSVGDKPTTGIYRKCNELQVVVSDGKDGGSGVVIILSVRTETWYKAKWWMRLHYKSKSKR